jgi:hypothetical protein
MENEIQLKSNHPPCTIEGCKNDTYGGSRGMCINHYSANHNMVKRGRTTWEELERQGIAKPLMTRGEKASLRRHKTKLQRVWSERLNQYIFVKIDEEN